MTNYSKNGDSTPKNEKKQTLNVKEIKPWTDPVDGALLFKQLTKTFKKYLALQEYQAETLALWTMFSYCIDANNIAPKLLIHSPEKRCGKTTLLDVLSELVWKPIMASNITGAVLFRVIEDVGGTIMIDEADTFIKKNTEIAGIINSGHRKKYAVVWRCVGDANIPTPFSTWAPTVIAMIGKPQDTIVDRSIIITMRRKRPEETVQRFIQHKVEKDLHTLARKAARWCNDNFDDLCDSDPQMPEGLNDRAADNWRPLLAIADLISQDCSLKARVGAVQLSQKEVDEDDSSVSTMLLSDICDMFESSNEKRISSRDLLMALHDNEERPWADWNRGREITPSQVAKYLRPFGIKPRKMRIYNQVLRGYDLEQFEDVFTRYLEGTQEQGNKNNGLSDIEHGTVPVIVPGQSHANTLKNNDSSVVPLKAGMPPPGMFDDDDIPCIFDE